MLGNGRDDLEENEIEVWHLPPGAIELLKHGHTGIRCMNHIYSFWPDSKGYEEGTAVVAPGYEAEDISRFAKWVNPPFWGYFRGIITRDTLYQSANRFYETDTRNPKEISKHPVSGGWILK